MSLIERRIGLLFAAILLLLGFAAARTTWLGLVKGSSLRQRASELAVQFRTAHGIKQPATLPEDELEYQEGWKERRTRLDGRFEVKPPLVWNGDGKRTTSKAPARA